MKLNTAASPTRTGTRRTRGAKLSPLFVIAMLALAGTYMVWAGWFAPVDAPRPPASGLAQDRTDAGAQVRAVRIPEGASAHQIASILEREGLVRSAAAFRLAARLTGKESSLKAGYYEIEAGTSIRDILDTISAGRVVMTRVTIPEGYTAAQIARLLASRDLADEDDFMALVSEPPQELREEFQFVPNGVSLEGYLFPDTYDFAPGVSTPTIVRAMLRRFGQAAQPELDSIRSARLSDRDLLILASIVEREIRVDAERPLAAGVFLNRLKKGMPLQSCATVQYVLPAPKERLLNDDLTVDSPYNTYMNNGLPPGPISNPGLASITAVVHPQATDYLYFVAKGDGSHEFTKTYEEHLRAQARAERQAKAGKR